MAAKPPRGASASLYTVIGDVVSSRKIPDQSDVYRTVQQALTWVNEKISVRFPLQSTIGDEFQGAYETLRDALLASLFVVLKLKGKLTVRFGLGRGEVQIAEPEKAPAGQSGSGWWRAREAIDAVAAAQVSKKGWPASFASNFVGEDPYETGLVNALLICRDEILSSMNPADARIALALFLEEPQQKVASELGLAQSTVSSHQRRHGPSALLKAHRALLARDIESE